MRTVTEARAAARAAARRAPDPDVIGMCLRTTRQLYDPDVPGGIPDAATAFRLTKLRGRGPAPAGAIHWWLGGAKGHGHVALGEGPKRVWSIDNVHAGKVDLVTLARIERTWPALRYVGWSRDINGVTVLPLVRLGALDPRTGVRPTRREHDAAIAVVTRALVDEGLLDKPKAGWSRDVLEAYAAWQEKAGYGPATPGRPGPSDGLPGIRSLTTLGLRRGFVVR